MEQLKMMKENLMSCVQAQMADLKNVDYKELGAAIDMIKDLSEATYYCTIVESMEQKDKNGENKVYYYTERMYPGDYYRDIDRDKGRMYYGPGRGVPNNGGETMYYSSRNFNPGRSLEGMRDTREGRSPMSRRMYMESKEMHEGKEKSMKELEKYMHELSDDITEMIHDATPDEKVILKQKLIELNEKIQ